MHKDYKAILHKAAEADAPFRVSPGQKKAALELAASGLVVLHEDKRGNIDVGLVVDGITVAGRDYLHRFWPFFGRIVFAMLLAVSSGLLGVVLARFVPARAPALRENDAAEQRAACESDCPCLRVLGHEEKGASGKSEDGDAGDESSGHLERGDLGGQSPEPDGKPCQPENEQGERAKGEDEASDPVQQPVVDRPREPAVE